MSDTEEELRALLLKDMEERRKKAAHKNEVKPHQKEAKKELKKVKEEEPEPDSVKEPQISNSEQPKKRKYTEFELQFLAALNDYDAELEAEEKAKNTAQYTVEEKPRMSGSSQNDKKGVHQSKVKVEIKPSNEKNQERKEVLLPQSIREKEKPEERSKSNAARSENVTTQRPIKSSRSEIRKEVPKKDKDHLPGPRRFSIKARSTSSTSSHSIPSLLEPLTPLNTVAPPPLLSINTHNPSLLNLIPVEPPVPLAALDPLYDPGKLVDPVASAVMSYTFNSLAAPPSLMNMTVPSATFPSYSYSVHQPLLNDLPLIIPPPPPLINDLPAPSALKPLIPTPKPSKPVAKVPPSKATNPSMKPTTTPSSSQASLPTPSTSKVTAPAPSKSKVRPTRGPATGGNSTPLANVRTFNFQAAFPANPVTHDPNAQTTPAPSSSSSKASLPPLNPTISKKSKNKKNNKGKKAPAPATGGNATPLTKVRTFLVQPPAPAHQVAHAPVPPAPVADTVPIVAHVPIPVPPAPALPPTASATVPVAPGQGSDKTATGGNATLSASVRTPFIQSSAFSTAVEQFFKSKDPPNCIFAPAPSLAPAPNPAPASPPTAPAPVPVIPFIQSPAFANAVAQVFKPKVPSCRPAPDPAPIVSPAPIPDPIPDPSAPSTAPVPVPHGQGTEKTRRRAQRRRARRLAESETFAPQEPPIKRYHYEFAPEPRYLLCGWCRAPLFGPFCFGCGAGTRPY